MMALRNPLQKATGLSSPAGSITVESTLAFTSALATNRRHQGLERFLDPRLQVHDCAEVIAGPDETDGGCAGSAFGIQEVSV
jgi:hypothetical protein